MVRPKFIIYALIDPRNGYLRYVGKSTHGLTRAREHCFPSRLRERGHRSHWLRTVIADGLKPTIVILDEVQTEAELNELETFYISYMRWIGCPLTNATEGGEGSTGAKASAETRAKMSASRKGRKHSPEHSAAIAASLKGHVISADTRAKISAAQKGNTHCLGRRVSEETISRMSDSAKRTSWIRGKTLPEATIVKMRAAAGQRAKDEHGRFK